MPHQKSLLCIIVLIVTVKGYRHCKTISTFNTGLIYTVPNLESRRPRISEALRQSTADFMCLQEFYFETDLIETLGGLVGTYPHHYSAIHASEDVLRKEDCSRDMNRVRDTPCSDEEKIILEADITQCGTANGCFQLQTPFRQLCVVTNCRNVFLNESFSSDCAMCVFFETFHLLGIIDALTECSTPKYIDNRMNPSGLMILSKTGMTNASFTSFFPSNRLLHQRGYIQATLDDGKKIVCTHLSADLPFYFEFDLPMFRNYREQSREEMNILGRTFRDIEHVLVGDINAGPRVTDVADPEKNLRGAFVENYEFLVGTFGYLSPYMEQNGRCTFCKENPLTNGQPNNVFDVVMVTNGSSLVTPSVQRTFTDQPEPISDHYGVSVEVCEKEI